MKQIFTLMLMGVFMLSCSNDDDNVSVTPNCDTQTIIDAQQYANVTLDQITINSLEIVDDCLTINFGASGCDGNSWTPTLIDANVILESFPPQRNLKFIINNQELCQAYFTKEVSFDVSGLQVLGGSVQLNLANTADGILYTY